MSVSKTCQSKYLCKCNLYSFFMGNFYQNLIKHLPKIKNNNDNIHYKPFCQAFVNTWKLLITNFTNHFTYYCTIQAKWKTGFTVYNVRQVHAYILFLWMVLFVKLWVVPWHGSITLLRTHKMRKLIQFIFQTIHLEKNRRKCESINYHDQ